MIETEKSILATCILFPRLLPVLFDNCIEGDFFANEHRIIYSNLFNRYEKKEPIDSIIMYDVLRMKVTKGYFSSVMETGQALPGSIAENWLVEKLSVLKSHNAKVNGIKECLKEFESNDPDFDKIIEIANYGKVIKINKEPVDFNAAHSEYLDWKNKEKTNVITGFPTLDRQIDGLNYGELFGIMGRTTAGKTFISINMLRSIIYRTAEKIGYFSLEMSKATFIERMMQVHFKQSRYEVWEKVKDGTLCIDEFMDKYKDLNIYSRVYSVAEISRLVERDELKIVFIDFLQLIKKTRGKSIYENVSYQIEELKELAKNKEVVIFLLIQLSRKGEGGWIPVTIDMARDSGTIEENCDFLMGVWNPSLYPDIDVKDEAEWRDKLSVKLLKNKRGITIGTQCHFDSYTGRIYEIEKHRQ